MFKSITDRQKDSTDRQPDRQTDAGGSLHTNRDRLTLFTHFCQINKEKKEEKTTRTTVEQDIQTKKGNAEHGKECLT